MVQVLLDTYHDHQNAFIFGTSPTAIEYDAQVSKAGQVIRALFPRRTAGQGGQVAQRGGAAATTPKDPEQLRGLVYGTEMPADKHEPWYRRPRSLALVVGAALVLLNVMFR